MLLTLIEWNETHIGLNQEVFIVALLCCAAVAIWMIWVSITAHREEIVTGEEALVGSEARVQKWSKTKGEVLTWGEPWAAISETPLSLKKGDIVYVVAKHKLTLTISIDKPE